MMKLQRKTLLLAVLVIGLLWGLLYIAFGFQSFYRNYSDTTHQRLEKLDS